MARIKRKGRVVTKWTTFSSNMEIQIQGGINLNPVVLSTTVFKFRKSFNL
jgi:hypothetical protein